MRDVLAGVSVAAAVLIGTVLPVTGARASTEQVYPTPIACEKQAGLGAATCRRAFMIATTVYEHATRSYPDRARCYRAFGPCMPWPIHAGAGARFRPQLMGVSVTGQADSVAAMPVIAPGRIRLALAPQLLSAALAQAAAPQTDLSGPPSETALALCRHIEAVAAEQHLPAAFLTRLLWQESSFRAGVVSPAGALGIAQFMPGTARDRGLADPLEPMGAIRTSAALLADLTRQFGNLGLAAAAYNGGPARVAGWLKGQRTLAPETEDYVLRITGRSPRQWAAMAGAGSPIAPAACLDLAAARFAHSGTARPQTPSETASAGGSVPTNTAAVSPAATQAASERVDQTE